MFIIYNAAHSSLLTTLKLINKKKLKSDAQLLLSCGVLQQETETLYLRCISVQ